MLLPCALLAATALVVFALLPSGAAPAAVVAPMAVAGAAMPPLGASVRTLLPGVMGCREQLRAAYALESSLIEITHVVGPLLIAGAIATRSTAAAAFACAALLVGGTAAFVATPASRSWRAERQSGDGPAARALASPGVRTLLLVVALMGLTFGAVEVGIPAAAEAAGAREATGPLLSVWALGSFAGGLLALRLRRPDGAVARLAATVAAFAAGHLLLAAAGALPVLAALLLIAGSAIAPTFAAASALVDGLAPQGGLTEAFAWLGTGIAGGFAAGGALGGWAAEQHGGDAALLIAGLAGIAALAVVAVRRATLSGPHRV